MEAAVMGEDATGDFAYLSTAQQKARPNRWLGRA